MLASSNVSNPDHPIGGKCIAVGLSILIKRKYIDLGKEFPKEIYNHLRESIVKTLDDVSSDGRNIKDCLFLAFNCNHDITTLFGWKEIDEAVYFAREKVDMSNPLNKP